MSGRLINGIKYMYINRCNDFKKKSLEEHLYYTLIDIFWNADSSDVCMTANFYNNMLTGNVEFNQRTGNFKYTNILNQKEETQKILTWLNRITQKDWFEFFELEDGEEIIEEEYIKFDDWWKQFEELRQAIKEQYEKNGV